MKTKIQKIVGLLIGLIIINNSIAQTTYYTRGTGGNWSNPATWSTAGCNGAPAAGIPGPLDNVVICNSNGGGAVTVTVDGNYTCNNLTIGSGNNNCYLNIAGTFTLNINGDLKINQGCFNQTFRLDAGAGVVNVNGTFSQWCTTNGNNQIWVGTGKIKFTPAVNQTTNNQFIRFYDAGIIEFNNGFSSTQNNAQFQTFTNAQIWFRGNYNQTTNTMDFTMGQTQFPVVYFDCIGCQINNTSRVDFGDVIIYDNAVVSTASGGNLNITGNLILNTNSTFNVTKNIPGNVSVVRSINDVVLNSGSALNINAGVAYLQIAGNWINNGGTLNATPPTTIRFEGIGNSIGGTSSTTFPNLQFGNTLNNVNYQINQNITCNDFILDPDNSYRNVTINTYSVQVNNNVIINQPTNNNTNILAVNGGTLNVSGNLNFVGGTNSNTQVGKLLVNTGLAQINGNITFMTNNTVLSEVLEVNSGTLNIQQDLNMPYNSGVINLIGSGVVNFNGNTAVSLNLNGTGGANAAQLNTVANSTVTFARGLTNGNIALTFADGSYQIFTGNGNITPNAAISFGHFQINTGVNVTNNGDFSVQNNWNNLGGTFIHNNRRVSFVGTSTQYISKPGGEIFYNVTSNCTGPVTLNDNVTILNNLTMTAGNWNVNGKLLILGNGTPSSLNRTAGIIYGGEFRRYWLAGTAITSNSGNFYGLFPIGTSTEYRPIEINSTAAPTTAGYIGAYHTDAYTATDGSWAANDGLGSTIQRMHDQVSTITNNGVGGGTYNLNVSFTALSSVGTLNDMRLMPYLSAGVGTHAAAIGTVPNPTVRRTGLTIAELPNTWAVGTINKDPVTGTPLRQPYYSRKTGNWSDVTPGNATWSTDPITLVSCDCKPTPGSLVVIKTGHVVTLDIPVTSAPNGPIDYLVIENGGSLVGTQNITINYDLEAQGTGNFAPTAGIWTVSRDLNLTGNGTFSTPPTAVFTLARHFNMSGNSTLNLNNNLQVGSANGGNFTLNGTINAGANTIILRANMGSKNISGTNGIINGTGTFNITNMGAIIMAGTSLTIQPDILISGAITVTNNGTITALGNINGSAGASAWTNASNSQLNIAGSLMATGVLNASANPNTVNYNGSNAPFAPIKLPSASTYHTLMISNNDNRRLSGNTIVSGNLIIQNNATLWDNGSSLTGTGGLIMSGNTTYSITNATNPVPSLTGIYSITGGLIKFARNNNQNIKGINGPAPSAYYDVEFANSGTKTLQGPILVQRNLTISGSAVLDVNLVGGNNYKITLWGNWIVDPAATTADHFNERTTNGNVEFAGNVLQTINWGPDNTRQFFNLTINNSAPSAAVQILGTAATSVANNVNFIDGHLITGSYTSPNFVIKDNATATGMSDSSHVKGAVVKEGNDAFTFPIGKGVPPSNAAMYAPISISAPATTTDRFVAEYFWVNPHTAGYDTSLHDPTLNHISGCEYWMLNRLSGTSNVSVTLSWYSPNASTYDPRSCGVTSLPDLSVARWDGTMWKDHGNGGTTGTTASGTIKTNGVVTAFSPFTLSSKLGGGVNPLPIELIYFTAVPRENYVELEWKTATQVNNDYFVVEKSVDAQNWTQLVIVKGAGTIYTPMEYLEIDPNPIIGINYYRLKQVDFDGTFSYSQIVAVEFRKQIASGNSNEPVIFPNPIGQNEVLNIQFPGWYTEALVVMRDMMGKEIFSKVIVFEENNLLYAIPLDKEIPSGIYLITASSNRNILFSKKVIVK